jgi:hypothetical protein
MKMIRVYSGILFIGLLVHLTSATAGPVCQRSSAVRQAIELELKKDCTQIDESELKEIVQLDLMRKNIDSLKPDDFKGMSSLDTLLLSENNLSDLPAGLFSDLGALTYLNLNYNEFAILTDGMFVGLNRLKELRLSMGTQYFTPAMAPMQIAPQAFSGLPSLKVLRMTHNRVLGLPDRLFASLSNLEVVDFSVSESFSQEVSSSVFASDVFSSKAYACLWGAGSHFSQNTMNMLMDQLGHRYHWWSKNCPR